MAEKQEKARRREETQAKLLKKVGMRVAWLSRIHGLGSMVRLMAMSQGVGQLELCVGPLISFNNVALSSLSLLSPPLTSAPLRSAALPSHPRSRWSRHPRTPIASSRGPQRI